MAGTTFQQTADQLCTERNEVLTFGNMPSINEVGNIRLILSDVFAHLGAPVSHKLTHGNFLVLKAVYCPLQPF